MTTLIYLVALGMLAALAAMLAKYAAMNSLKLKPAYARSEGRRGRNSSYPHSLHSGALHCDGYDAELRLQPVADAPGPSKSPVRAPSWPGFLPSPAIFWPREKSRNLPADDVIFKADSEYRAVKERDRLTSWLREVFEDLGVRDDVRVLPQGSLTKRLPLERDVIKRLHREAEKIECSAAPSLNDDGCDTPEIPDSGCRNPSRKQRHRYERTEVAAVQGLALLDDGPSDRHARMERRVRDELRRTFESCGDYDRARLIRAKVARSVPEPFRHVVNQALADAYRAA